MRKLVALLLLAGLLSACTITISPAYIPIPEYTVEVNRVYRGTLVYTGYPYDSRRLVLDFVNNTYQINGSYPTHMYWSPDSREIILGEVGAYRLFIVERGENYITGTWTFSSRLVSGTFYVER